MPEYVNVGIRLQVPCGKDADQFQAEIVAAANGSSAYELSLQIRSVTLDARIDFPIEYAYADND